MSHATHEPQRHAPEWMELQSLSEEELRAAKKAGRLEPGTGPILQRSRAWGYRTTRRVKRSRFCCGPSLRGGLRRLPPWRPCSHGERCQAAVDSFARGSIPL
jgi:hypothetical protein